MAECVTKGDIHLPVRRFQGWLIRHRPRAEMAARLVALLAGREGCRAEAEEVMEALWPLPRGAREQSRECRAVRLRKLLSNTRQLLVEFNASGSDAALLRLKMWGGQVGFYVIGSGVEDEPCGDAARDGGNRHNGAAWWGCVAEKPRLDAIARVLKGELTAGEGALVLGVSPEVLEEWLAAFVRGGVEALACLPDFAGRAGAAPPRKRKRERGGKA